MIRIAFLTAGLTLALWGAALFVVDEVTLSEQVSASAIPALEALSSVDSHGRRIIHPAEWMRFTFVGVGGVTMLYAVALPRKD